MATRGRVPASSSGRPDQAPATARHENSAAAAVGGPRRAELLRHPELLEAKIAAQASEIAQLVGDNRRLASTHAVLREELAAARQEAERLRAQMRTVQTESDIQIRSLLEKASRAEATSLRAGDGPRSEVQRAIKEAQGLVVSRQELNSKIQGVAKELHKARDDIKSLPNLRSELDSLRKEHQRLRSTFEYEKGSNEEQVEQLQVMEQKLISMANEVEKLRAVDVVSCTVNRANALKKPYLSGYSNPDNVAHVPVNRPNAHETGKVGPTSGGDIVVTPNDGAVVGTSTDTVVPNGTESAAADTGSAGASASISDDDVVMEEEEYDLLKA